MAVDVQAKGGLGLKFGLDASQHGPDQPAFWSYVILAVLLVGVIAVAHSLR